MFHLGFGDYIPLWIICDFFGDLFKQIFVLVSLSGEGDEPGPLAEFLRDDGRTLVSKWRNLEQLKQIYVD